MARILILAILFHHMVDRLDAQELIALDAGGGLYSVDPKAGTTTFIGSSGMTQYLWTGLAKDGQGRLFACYGYYSFPYAVYEIDPGTGQARFVMQTQLNGISGMAFDAQGVLYVTHDTTAPSSPHPYDLFAIDLVQGTTSRIGFTGLFTITGLDFDERGRLWAYDYEVGLVELDVATGAATDVNPNFVGPPYPTKSMVFGEDGALWLLDLAVWVGDTTTGVPSMVTPMSYFGLFSGVEYRPGPTPPFALWTLGETGGAMGARAVGATPGGTVAIVKAQGGGGPTAVPPGNACAGTLLDLNASISVLRVLRADAQGRVEFGPAFVPVSAAGSVRLQAVELTTCATSNLARIVF